MAPTILGLFVAILSLWFYRYLSSRMDAFDLEMESASVGLLNRLVVHLGRLGPPAKIFRVSCGGQQSARLVEQIVEGPRLSIQRIYRHGVLELIWPRLASAFDADSVLSGGMWISFVYALIGWLACFHEGRPITGDVIFLFFAVAGLGLRAGSLLAILSLLVYFAFSCLVCVLLGSWIPYPACLAAASLLLIGSLKAARFLPAKRVSTFLMTDARWQARAKSFWQGLRPLQNMLVVVLSLSACTAMLFGTVFTLYPMGADYSMEPNLQTGDWIISVNPILRGAMNRGELVNFYYWVEEWGNHRTERVVGLLGDHIRVEAGKLILNGKSVVEPYCQQLYRGGLGDFPLPSDAYPDDSLRWRHNSGYGDTLQKGKEFIVPESSYFVLNDDRNELMDSRIFGPLPKENVAGRPILSYSFRQGPWSLPHFIH